MRLITGASGLLGRALVSRLSGGAGVAGVSKSGRHQTTICDLSDPSSVEKLFKNTPFTAVIHTAAYSDVDGCERDPELAHRSNALATKYLAQMCSQYRIPLVHISTDYVFDGKKKSPYQETDPTHPVNIYGLTKLEGEFQAAIAPVSAIVRTSWLFGNEDPKNFVNAVLNNLKTQSLVRVLEDQEDRPTYVKDLALAIEKITIHLEQFLKKNPEGRLAEIFHVANQGGTTRYQMTLEMKKILGLSQVTVETLDKDTLQGRLAIRPPYAVMSTKKYDEFFGGALRPWQEAMRDYLKGE